MTTTANATSVVSPQPTFRLWSIHHRTTIAVAAAAALVYVATLIIVPQFASVGHLASLSNTASALGIVAIGAGIVIIGGGIDLAIPNVITASGVVASTLTVAGLPVPLVITVSLLVGAVVGLVNGFAVSLLGIPPLVVTLAVGNILQGVLLLGTGGTPQSAAPAVLTTVANTPIIFGFTGSTVVWVVLSVIAITLLSKTTFGRSVYAVGTNPRVADLAGLPIRATAIVTYVISGVTASLAGLLLLGYTGISTSTVGDSYLLPAIAAVVLGGTSILGGQGNAVGIAAGVFLLMSVESLLTVISVPVAVRQILEGAIILFVLALYSGRLIPQRLRRHKPTYSNRQTEA